MSTAPFSSSQPFPDEWKNEPHLYGIGANTTNPNEYATHLIQTIEHFSNSLLSEHESFAFFEIEDGIGESLRNAFQGTPTIDKLSCIFRDVFTLEDTDIHRRAAYVNCFPEVKILFVTDAKLPLTQLVRRLVHSYGFRGLIVYPFASIPLIPIASLEKRVDPFITLTGFVCGSGRFMPGFKKLMSLTGCKKYDHHGRSHPLAGNARFVQNFRKKHTGELDYYPVLFNAAQSVADSLSYFEWADIHWPASVQKLCENGGIRVLFLGRDPRDHLISMYYFLRRSTAGLMLSAPERACPNADLFLDDSKKEEGLIACIEGKYRKDIPNRGYYIPPVDLLVENMCYSQKSNDAYLVRFENVHAAHREEFQKVFHWLDLDPSILQPIRYEDYEEAAGRGVYKREVKAGEDANEFSKKGWVRKGVPGDWINHFTPKVKECFKSRVGQGLIELGYESSFDW